MHGWVQEIDQTSRMGKYLDFAEEKDESTNRRTANQPQIGTCQLEEYWANRDQISSPLPAPIYGNSELAAPEYQIEAKNRSKIIDMEFKSST